MTNRLPTIASIICTALVVQLAIEAAHHPVGDLMPAMVEVTFASLVLWWAAGMFQDRIKKGDQMIKAQEIASLMLSEKDLKSRAKSLRATASSLRTEVEFAGNRQLSDREVASLSAAANIMSKLGARYAEAATLKGEQIVKQQSIDAAATAEVRQTFGTLQSEDIPALALAMGGEAGLKRWREGKADLPEILESIGWRAGYKARDGDEAAGKVREAWVRFQAGKEEYAKNAEKFEDG